MKTKVFLTAAILTLTLPPVWAQGHGGGQHGGQGRPPQGQGQGQQQGMGGDAGRGTMDRDRTQDRQRVHATDQQRDQLRSCDQSMDRVRTRARDMAKTAGGGNFSADQTRQHRDQLREQLRTMEQEHGQLMNGLNADQKQALEVRHRQMEQIHERMNARLQKMDKELGEATPNGKRVAEHARAVEREMKQLQKHNREMQSEMGVKP